MPLYKKLDTPSVIVKGQNQIMDVWRLLTELSRNLDAILNRGIRPDLNVDCRLVTVTSHATPGTEFSVSHGLGKKPVGYRIWGQGGPGSVYDGTTPKDMTTLYLRSDASLTDFRLEVF